MEVTAAVEDIKNLLQPKITEELRSPAEGEEPKSVLHPKKAKKTAAAPEAEVEDDGWESGSIDDAGVKADDGWESGSVKSAYSNRTSESDSSESTPTSKKTLLKAGSNPNAPTKTKTSTPESKFLPSLSVGFVRGDSDSEFSDVEAPTEMRKNRRGQRARRASVLLFVDRYVSDFFCRIWEKKYGRNANHTKKEREAMASSNSKSKWLSDSTHANVKSLYGPKRGRNQDQQSKMQYTQQVDSGLDGRDTHGTSNGGSSVQAVNIGEHKREERALHPSWEAKRKQKEKQSGGILPPQGKKIKF